ncbi:hypothetical protein O3G_MSEX004467 [Manduca sexta]|uniref:Uncharacterized protein n=1 Tax=Manduca sexta TaxID=7130 RepID=A0A922CHQ9_MANSE|nr:hypothetical protein O3G_MSEX004467 [Manduca sexta]
MTLIDKSGPLHLWIIWLSISVKCYFYIQTHRLRYNTYTVDKNICNFLIGRVLGLQSLHAGLDTDTDNIETYASRPDHRHAVI